MTTLRNTLEGYEVEAATPIPDEEDPGVGFGAGDRVRVNDEHETYPGEEGVVQAVARGIGMREGQVVIDVLIDGTSEAERFEPYELEGE